MAEIKRRRDKLNTARVEEMLLQQESKRPGGLEKTLSKRQDELRRLEKKRGEKDELERRLAALKERHGRQQQHYRLAMEGYRTEMNQMRAQIALMRKELAGDTR